jgi:hypothetical protein
MKKLLSVLSILLLTACGTTSTLTETDLAKKIPAGYARIIVKREVAFSYAGSGALVEVNDKMLGTLGGGGEGFLDVKAGPVSVTVKATGAIESPYVFSIASIHAKAGKTYRFIVLANSSRAWKAAAFSGAFGPASGAVYDASNQDGYFQVQLEKTQE